MIYTGRYDHVVMRSYLVQDTKGRTISQAHSSSVHLSGRSVTSSESPRLSDPSAEMAEMSEPTEESSGASVQCSDHTLQSSEETVILSDATVILSDATVVIMSESKSVSGNCHIAKKSNVAKNHR